MGEIYEPKDRQIGTLIAQGGLIIFFFLEMYINKTYHLSLERKCLQRR